MALICVVLALVFIVADWLTSAGVVVGILLGVPIVLSSTSEDSRDVWLVTLVSIVGFTVAAIFGREPISPREVWVPNRIMTALSLPASAAVALLLHGQRSHARNAAEEARRTSQLNRLLLSLLAHDLRSPLAMALQAIDYVRASNTEEGQDLDDELLEDVGTFLRRSIGTIDGILSLAQTHADAAPSAMKRYTGTEVARLMEAEAWAFEEQARSRGKDLRIEIASSDAATYLVDALVTRQVVAILVDNAVRYAKPGTIRLRGGVEGGEVRLEVADEGPGLSATRESTEAERGSGLGLELCRALVYHAGGDLVVSRDGPDGTSFDLRLPLRSPPP